MVRILQIHRIQVWSAPGCATIAGSPRIVHRAVPRQTELAAVLGTVKDKPFGWRYRAILDRPRARRPGELRSGRKNARGAGRTKEWTWKRWYDPPWQQTSHTRPGPMHRSANSCSAAPTRPIRKTSWVSPA